MAAKDKPAERRFRLRIGDAVVVALVLLAAAGFLFFLTRANAGEKGTLAIIEVNGKEAKRVVLAQGQPARRFTVKGVNGPSTFEVKDGRVHMVKSTCRDKICIGEGWIDTRGAEVVCLPNRVVIHIPGNKVDTVTQ